MHTSQFIGTFEPARQTAIRFECLHLCSIPLMQFIPADLRADATAGQAASAQQDATSLPRMSLSLPKLKTPRASVPQQAHTPARHRLEIVSQPVSEAVSPAAAAQADIHHSQVPRRVFAAACHTTSCYFACFN